ncbi:hypothetical protein [Streptomyces sp. B1866]|uniref:hypothetical protein n=1 Tax=Streptomyces sp. B1866 TaxID=3075431 RepID=UPI00289FC4A3|nr:hypothetical protein [Streptomyces sp. B1866]
MTEVDEGGQESVDEHQPVLRAGAHGPLPRSAGKSGLVTLMPQRAYLGHQFSDHICRQARDPAVTDDHCASRVPHHPTMVNHQGLDVSPPTVHELVRSRSGPYAPLDLGQDRGAFRTLARMDA